MEINVMDDEKLVTIWLTRAEQADAELRERLKPLYAKYKAKKYMVAQFHSAQRTYTKVREICFCITAGEVPNLQSSERKNLCKPSKRKK